MSIKTGIDVRITTLRCRHGVFLRQSDVVEAVRQTIEMMDGCAADKDLIQQLMIQLACCKVD